MAEVGRNLSAELDEVKEKIEHMIQNQEQLKAIMLDIRDSLNNSQARVSESGSPSFSFPVMIEPMRASHHDYCCLTEPIPIPIGEEYPLKKENEVSYIRQVRNRGSQSPSQAFAYQVNNIPTPRNPTQTTNTRKPLNLIRTTYTNSSTYPPNTQTRPANFQNPNTNTRHNPNRSYPNLPPFPKLAISNAELFQQLMNRRLIAPLPVLPIKSNFPSWYNANLTCEYHMDVPGHSIEDCEQFKTSIRKLMACGKLDFRENVGPNREQDPTPKHDQGNKVNAIGIEEIPIIGE